MCGQDANTRHDGSISTAHANSARDLLSRIETMVLSGFEIPMQALRGQISSALEIIIHLGRLRDHSRRVLEIVEVLGMNGQEIECNSLFTFEEKVMQNEKEKKVQETASYEVPVRVNGQLIPVHRMKQLHKLKEAGYYGKYVELMKRMRIER